MDPTLDKMLSLEKHFSEIKADVSDIKIAQVLQALSQQNYERLPSFLPSFHSFIPCLKKRASCRIGLVADGAWPQDIMRTRALQMKSALEKAKAKGLSGFTT